MKPKRRTSKPNLGLPDPLEAAQEIARNAQEGNDKLRRAVDVMRGALETIIVAEMDQSTGLLVTAADLRLLATQAMDAYSRLTGQNWRLAKNKIVESRAGDRNLNTLEA